MKRLLALGFFVLLSVTMGCTSGGCGGAPTPAAPTYSCGEGTKLVGTTCVPK